MTIDRANTKRLALIFFSLMMAWTSWSMLPAAALPADAYADGEYVLPFEVLQHNADERSAAGDYIVSPATLVIEGAAMHVLVTLNNSSWWQSFQTEAADGSYADVDIISENAEAGTRIVKFDVFDVEQPLAANIHIIVTGIPGFEYDNTYNIRFKFDASAIPLATSSQPTPETEPDGEPEQQPEQEPQSGSEQDPATDAEQEPQSEAQSESEQVPDAPADQLDQHTAEQIPPKTVDEADEAAVNKVVFFGLLALVLLAIIFVVLRMRKR